MKVSSFCKGNQRSDGWHRDNTYFYSKVMEHSFVKPKFQYRISGQTQMKRTYFGIYYHES